MPRLHKRGRTWWVWAYDLDGQRRHRSTRCTDRRAAEARARQIEAELLDPRAHVASATVTSALERFVERVASDADAGARSPATLSFYRKKAGHLYRLLGGVHLVELGAGDVDAYLLERRREGAADATIGKEFVTLRQALKLAARAGDWPGRLEAVMPVRFGGGYVPRRRALPWAELAALLPELLADRAARVAWIVATSGRWGESDRACRADVDLEAMLVHVRGTKTRSSDRVVPLVLPVQQVLVAYALDYGEGEGGLLFRPWPNVRHDLEAACSRAKVERCSPNDLRRTFAKWLREHGATPDLVGLAMGHTTGRMVELVYGRLTPLELGRSLGRSMGVPPALLLPASSSTCTDQGQKAMADPAPIEPSTGSHVDQRMRTRPDSSDASDSVKAENASEVVPRDGIEPPTRGFSVPVVPRPKPAFFRHLRLLAVPGGSTVVQRGRR